MSPRRRSAIAVAALSAAAATALPALAADDGELRNWFDDPFFQVSSAIADCPPPRGPYLSEAEKRVQAHHRAEKGTTCWLARECDRPSSFAYDGDIAAAFRSAAAQSPAFDATTLWVTVQGRVVYVEGCVPSEPAAAAVESFARALPYVVQAMAIVRVGPGGRVPYRLRAER